MKHQIKSLYVGCALTQAPLDYRNMIEQLKIDLRKDYEVFDFLGLKTGTAIDVYQWDIHRCVAKSDLVVAICDYPSIGLGYEIATAIEALHKPVLALAHTDSHITRLIQGISAPGYTFERYNSTLDIPMQIRSFINQLTPER